MKKAKIMIGIIVIGATLAFLLSWPDKLTQHPQAPITVIFSDTIYDKVLLNQNRIAASLRIQITKYESLPREYYQ